MRAPGPAGSHKGYALAAMVEVLCCVLTGMAWGHHTIEMYRDESSLARKRGLGQFYVIMRPDLMRVGGSECVLSVRSAVPSLL